MKSLRRTEGLLVPQKCCKRKQIGRGENGIVRRRAPSKEEVWSMDLMSYHTVDGRSLRMLVVLDACARVPADRGAQALPGLGRGSDAGGTDGGSRLAGTSPQR